MGILNLFKRKTVRERIIEKFYSDYPEIPYISDDREAEWIDKASLFNNMPVKKSMMQRFPDGLLPGHVYMLYWLDKFTNKRSPAYFEYQYGIDFEKEKQFLIDSGFLNRTAKPTDKGNKAIEEHHDIVEAHSKPKKKIRSIEEITEQILMSRDSLIANGFKEYKVVSSLNACEKCKELSDKHFLISEMQIGVNAPPFHDGCMCAISAYEDPDDYEAWLDFLDKGGTTKEWEKLKKAR